MRFSGIGWLGAGFVGVEGLGGLWFFLCCFVVILCSLFVFVGPRYYLGLAMLLCGSVCSGRRLCPHSAGFFGSLVLGLWRFGGVQGGFDWGMFGVAMRDSATLRPPHPDAKWHTYAIFVSR